MNLVVSVKDATLLGLLRGYPERVLASLQRAMQRLTLELQIRVKEQKLSGQVLHVRTGTLRRSVNRLVEVRAGQVVGSVGTNVAYAGAHEYGFDGNVAVPGYLRKVAARSEFLGRGGALSAQGVAFVKPHTRHLHLPERSFLRSALKELETRAATELRRAALDPLRVN